MNKQKYLLVTIAIVMTILTMRYVSWLNRRDELIDWEYHLDISRAKKYE